LLTIVAESFGFLRSSALADTSACREKPDTLPAVSTNCQEQDAAPNRFIQVTGEIRANSLNSHVLSAKEAAGKSHAWWLEFVWIGRREEAPKAGALGDIGRVDGVQSDFGCLKGRAASPTPFFIWWTGKIRVLVFPILPCVRFEIMLPGSAQRF